MYKSICMWSGTFIKKINIFNKGNGNKKILVVKTQLPQPRKISESERLRAVANFRSNAVDAIVRSFLIEYSDNMSLVKEIKNMMGYCFDVVEDDFYFGNGALRRRITKIDDYIFSQYRRNPKLKENIDKLRTIAESKRFKSNPRDNLIAYFVFIEEMDFEVMSLLEDFYVILESGVPKIRVAEGIDNNPSGLSKAEMADQSFIITDKITRF